MSEVESLAIQAQPGFRSICVYCSSSSAVAPVYFAAARELGTELARRGLTLVYGGARVGLMGAVATAVKASGGRVVGVIPEMLMMQELVYEENDELIITRDMRDRKATMMERSDAFLVLPGGFGTLEEFFETFTLRQLHRHSKPIIFLNTQGYYAPLLALFEHLYREQFAKPCRELYYVASDVTDAFSHLDSYVPIEPPDKWFQSEGGK